MLDLSMGIRLTSVALRRGAGALGQSALYQSLQAGDYWALDEASGTRASAFNSQTLTDNNTVGSDTGKVNALAADFVAANSEYLSRASEARLQTGDIDFWVAAWVRPSRMATAIALKDTSGARGYGLVFTNASNNARMQVGDGGSNINTAISSDNSPLDAWHFVIGWKDGSTINVQADNGTVASQVLSITPVVNTAAFEIGRQGSFGAHMGGRIGPVYLGKGHVPTAADRSFLWNDGNGRTLAEVEAYAG